MTNTVRVQCNKNAGRTGGQLVAVLHAPTGRYELLASHHIPRGAPAKAATWVPRRAVDDVCELLRTDQ